MKIEFITNDLKRNKDLVLNENAKVYYDNAIKNKINCPYCGCEEIGIDNWGMFDGIKDWFYYCCKCDDTFGIKTSLKSKE